MDTASQDPFAMDTAVTNNTEAFRAAAEHISLHSEDFFYGRRNHNDLDSALRARGLKYDRQFAYHQQSEESTISFNNRSYTWAGDTLYQYYVLYSRKPKEETNPSAKHRGMVRKIDSDLYYIVYIAECPDCDRSY